MTTIFQLIQFSSIAIQSIALASTMLLLGCAGSAGLARELSNDLAEPSQLSLKTDRVIVFKDGYCLVVKKGTATTDADGLVFTDEVPDAAVLGSFWAVPENGTIESLVAGWVNSESETKRELSCINIIEVVKANLGKQCAFEIGERRIAGTLLKILSNDDLPNDPEELSDGQQPSISVSSSFTRGMSVPIAPQISISNVTAAYFLVRTHDGDVMIQASEVKREFNALKWRGHDYARVEGEINIELANHKTEPVPVQVRLRFGGKTNEVSDEGRITTESFRQEDWQNRKGDLINNSSTVSWTATVQPGECFKPIVNYEFYLRY